MARKVRRPTLQHDHNSDAESQQTSARPTVTPRTGSAAPRSRRTTLLSIRLVFGIAIVVLGWLLLRANRTPATGVAQTTQAGDLQVTLHVDDTALGARVLICWSRMPPAEWWM
jgi:hypothetical protein